MNSAVIVALFGFLAVSNAGLLAAPAVPVGVVRTGPILAPAPLAYAAPSLTYAATPVIAKTAYAGPIVGAPVLTTGHGLVRVARSADPGVLAASPALTYAAAPAVAYHHAPAVVAAPVGLRTGVLAPAPLTYAASPVIASGGLVRVARSADPEPGHLLGAPVVPVGLRTGVLAPAPLTYAATPVIAKSVYSAPIVGAPVIASGPALVRVARSPEPEPGHLVAAPVVPVVRTVPVLAAVPAVTHTRSYHLNPSPVAVVKAPVFL